MADSGEADRAIRVMIVDDEPFAREGIRLRLQDQSDFELVGEFGSAEVALPSIRRERPEVLFLHIRMPGVDGFELLERTGLDVVPIIPVKKKGRVTLVRTDGLPLCPLSGP